MWNPVSRNVYAGKRGVLAGRSGPFSGRGNSSGPVYTPEAQALFARMDVQPDAARKGLINQTIAALKTAGLWDKMDYLRICAAHTSQAGALNWIKNAHNATLVGSPIFTTDRGFQGDGVSAYLDSNFNPFTQGVQYTQNNAHLGAWSLTNMAGSYCDLGVQQSQNVNQAAMLMAISGIFTGRPNTLFISVDFLNADSNIHGVTTRPNSNDMRAYKDGAFISTSTTPSAPPHSASIFEMARNNGGVAQLFSPRQYFCFHAGANLSDAEVTSLYNILNTYKTAVGA